MPYGEMCVIQTASTMWRLMVDVVIMFTTLILSSIICYTVNIFRLTFFPRSPCADISSTSLEHSVHIYSGESCHTAVRTRTQGWPREITQRGRMSPSRKGGHSPRYCAHAWSWCSRVKGVRAPPVLLCSYVGKCRNTCALSNSDVFLTVMKRRKV